MSLAEYAQSLAREAGRLTDEQVETAARLLVVRDEEAVAA